jgi:hypothetical protein
MHVTDTDEKELPTDSGVPLKVHHGPDLAIADPTGEGSPMKSSFAALALGSALAASPAWAQAQSAGSLFGGTQSRSPSDAAAPAPLDNRVIKAGAPTPALTPASDLKPPDLDLPNEPIEPYLLTKADGPFMVLARVFRGVDAEKMALALTKELRQTYRLPAFILRTKDYPGKSLMRGTPPTVPSEVMAPDIKMPEKVRTFDEAAVLIGNAKTLADQEKLWHQVRKIKPECLKKMSSPFIWRDGLSKSYRTTNPYVPVQYLYPKTKDRLVVQMNSGLRSIVNCPGRYSLQIAEFAGRSGFQMNTLPQPNSMFPNLRDSPLRTAHENAEKVAEKLAKDPEFQRLGQPVYVVHDRTASRVFVGAFDAPKDPRAGELRERLMQMSYPLADKRTPGKNSPGARGKNALDIMIVPALALTDVTDLKAKMRN